MKTELAGRARVAPPLIALWVMAPASARRSMAAECDQSSLVTFTGTMRKIMWLKSHIYTDIEIKQRWAT
jgi:hypothetical protein